MEMTGSSAGKDSKTGLEVLAWPACGERDGNPYTALMYSALVPPHARVIDFKPLARAIATPDVFHIHWPEGIFAGRLGGHLPFAALKAWRVIRTARRTRRRGGVVALTIHNFEPHARLSPGQRSLWWTYRRKLLAEVNLLIGLSETGVERYRELNPGAGGIDACIIPHPHFRDSYPVPPSRASARERLGIAPEKRVVGSLGALRPSKKIPGAIAAFRAAADEDDLFLIMGDGDEKVAAELHAAAGGDDRVRIVIGTLSEAALATAFAAIDVCLINQENTLNSGTALLALSMERQVIAPAVGALPELQEQVGPNWMALFPPPLDPARLRALLDGLPPVAGPVASLDQLDPGVMSREMLDAFASRLGRAERSRSALNRVALTSSGAAASNAGA